MAVQVLRPRMRKGALYLASLVASIALLISATPPKAAASSSGCTGVSDGYTCFYINGGGTYVDNFVQSRTKVSWPPGPICNYKAHFTASWYGTQYWDGWSSYHSGCFYTVRATRTLYVRAYYANNTYACGSWYENGSRLGTACNWIFR
jgi:hypothetical protein